VYRNASRFGGDPNQLYVSGVSSGGHLASVVLPTDWQKDFGLPIDIVKGGLCASGMYDLYPVTLSARSNDVRFTTEVVEALSAQRHLKVWRDLQRQGPEALIGPRAAFYYFWLCVFVLAVVPPTVVPSDVLPRLPRFVLVLTSLALGVIAVAVPLGLRDWRRVVRSLEDSTDAGA
jgi:acetyl esterase/lipase